MNREYLKSRCFEDVDENWWERRTGMERCMLISLFITITFSIGCVTFITLQYLLSDKLCTNTVCIEAALKLAAQINDSVDPCEDFLQYSCQNIPEAINLEQKVKDQVNLLVQELIDENDHSSVKQEKELFLICMNETSGENAISVFQEMLEDIGGWPVVVGYRWRARVFDWTDAVYALRSQGFPFSIFFSVSMSGNKIFVSNHLDSNFGYNRDLYRNFMTDTAVAFGADRYQAQLQMEDVLLFAEELRNISKDKIDDKNRAEELFATELTLEEFQKMYDEVQWIDFLNNLFYPFVTVTSMDTVIVPSHDYLSAVLDLLSATPKRIQANYLVWKVIEEMIPFMSKQLQNLKANYTCQTGGTPNTDRTEFCTSFLDSVYYIRPLQIVFLKSLSAQFNTQIEELTEDIKSEFLTLIKNSELDEVSKEESLSFLRSIKNVIGLSDSAFNETLFDSIVTDNEENPFKVVLKAQKIYVDIILTLDFQLNDTNLYDATTSGNVFYSKTSNTIIIPKIFVQEFYKLEQPMYLNYANVGTVYAQTLVDALWDNVESFSNNSITTSLQNEADCLGIDRKFITYKLGLNLVHQAYSKWTEKNARESKLIGFSQTPVQLLWISALSTNCADFQDTNTTDLFFNHNFVKTFDCSNLVIQSNCDNL